MIVIWPSYLDATLTRRMGRRIPKEIAVPNPRIEEVEGALKELNVKYVLENEKSYPRTWFKDKGRILVEKKWGKNKIIREIALIINRNRKVKMEEEKRRRGVKR